MTVHKHKISTFTLIAYLYPPRISQYVHVSISVQWNKDTYHHISGLMHIPTLFVFQVS